LGFFKPKSKIVDILSEKENGMAFTYHELDPIRILWQISYRRDMFSHKAAIA